MFELPSYGASLPSSSSSSFNKSCQNATYTELMTVGNRVPSVCRKCDKVLFRL